MSATSSHRRCEKLTNRNRHNGPIHLLRLITMAAYARLSIRVKTEVKWLNEHHYRFDTTENNWLINRRSHIARGCTDHFTVWQCLIRMPSTRINVKRSHGVFCVYVQSNVFQAFILLFALFGWDTSNSIVNSTYVRVTSLDHILCYNFSTGVKVVYDVSKPPGSRVESAQVLCANCSVPIYEPLIEDKIYSIVLNSYLMRGGDGFDMFKKRIGQSQLGKVNAYRIGVTIGTYQKETCITRVCTNLQATRNRIRWLHSLES